MRRQWTNQRRFQPTADAARLWAQAYQHLLEWTRLDELTEAPRPRPHEPKRGEMTDENHCDLCSTERQAQAQTIHQQVERLQAYLATEGRL